MHSSMHYEITTKSNQLFAESVQNNMHYEIFYAYEKVYCIAKPTCQH